MLLKNRSKFHIFCPPRPLPRPELPIVWSLTHIQATFFQPDLFLLVMFDPYLTNYYRCHSVNGLTLTIGLRWRDDEKETGEGRRLRADFSRSTVSGAPGRSQLLLRAVHNFYSEPFGLLFYFTSALLHFTVTQKTLQGDSLGLVFRSR